MKVHSLFSSLQGEGRFQGSPSFFIRLYGCNLDCVYCDATEAVKGGKFKDMTVSEIVDEVEKAGIEDVCITGGEPLCQKEELNELVSKLQDRRITLETNGSLDIAMNLLGSNSVFCSVDWKTPASGNADFNKNNIEVLKNGKGWIKFVVSDDEDLRFVAERLKYLDGIEVFISPVFEEGQTLFKKVSDFVMTHRNVIMQLQMHKILEIE